MKEFFKSGKIWPYAISLSIVFIFSACIVTIIVSSKLPVENSDKNMMYYHDADAAANDIIKAKIDFDKNYKINYIADGLNTENTVIKYEITDLYGEKINNAVIKVIVTRPNKHKYNQELLNPNFDNGVYSFNAIELPLEGRWNIMANVKIGDKERYYNVKVDTRVDEVYEY
ncbi:MAG: FixH family protein [Sulfurimonas sp.]|nr:FixH family protein [Sulfurimonas sp.]